MINHYRETMVNDAYYQPLYPPSLTIASLLSTMVKPWHTAKSGRSPGVWKRLLAEELCKRAIGPAEYLGLAVPRRQRRCRGHGMGRTPWSHGKSMAFSGFWTLTHNRNYEIVNRTTETIYSHIIVNEVWGNTAGSNVFVAGHVRVSFTSCSSRVMKKSMHSEIPVGAYQWCKYWPYDIGKGVVIGTSEFVSSSLCLFIWTLLTLFGC